MSQKAPAIEVVGARTHNLKGIDCRIPHAQVTVVTGLSGAGKSSLAFDTVYAEAQRRFVESMSTYARQFLDQMERPPIEAMHNILPAVALEARNSIKNARSTVGTITEVYDVLRLLYTHLGEVACPNGHGGVRADTPQEVADAVVAGEAGRKVLLLACLPRPKRGANVKLKELVRQGYGRRLEDGEVVRMSPSDRWLVAMDPLPLVLGRFTGKSSRARIAEAIEEAYQLTGGKVQVIDVERSDDDGGGGARHFGRALTCAECGAGVPRPVPPLFSFNSPLGACPTCQGFGRVIGIDRERVIPDPSKTLEERPIAPWNTPAHAKRYRKLFAACREAGIPLDVPWQELTDDEREFVWSGRHANLDKFFKRLERKIYKMHVRILLSRYRAYNPCPDCGGSRLKPEALAVTLRGKTVPEINAMTIEQLRAWLARQKWRAAEREVAGYLLAQLEERLSTLHRVGLDYLSLDRQARTLSGGEAQRIQLAAALGSGLTSTLYVLDEPTIGLHPQDSDALVELLRDLARRGNTVLVVEHDRTLIRGADHVIDLGPAAGEHGGEVVSEGPLEEVLANDESLTAQYLRERPRTASRRHYQGHPGGRQAKHRRREQGLASQRDEIDQRPRIEILGAAANNLRDFDVELPLESLVAVTGVSGSGKSTLIENVLHGTYQRSQGVVDVEPGECEGLVGLNELADVTLVDQRPLGRSSRSNPVTYVKAYDEIRKLFAATQEAKRRHIEPGHFSFNLDRGRCPECRGTGVLEVDMQFMAPVSVRCDTCQGRRFKAEVLAVTCRGRNIAETLELTVEEALEVFADRAALCRRLQALADVGLAYLRLGQPTSTLSGGEAQRLKLASFLDRSDGRRLFLFDEPTTGLHLADIDLLCRTLRRLVERGHGVVVVEHATDLIARADWIVDLGPGGGVHGGELLFSGPLESFLDLGESPTARELRRHLRWRRRRKRVVA